jgi:hypothetical protein
LLCHGVLLSHWCLAIVIGIDADVSKGAGFSNAMPLVSRHCLSIALYIF